MTKRAKEIRKKMAETYWNEYWPQRDPESEIHLWIGFNAGYKTGVQELEERIVNLRQALMEIQEEAFHGNNGTVEGIATHALTYDITLAKAGILNEKR